MKARSTAWMQLKLVFCVFTLLATPFFSGCAAIQRLTGIGDDSIADRGPSSEMDPDAIEARKEKQRLRLQAAENNRDVILGMQMRDVRSAWGEPTEVQTAGDQSWGNQKWIYQEGLSTRWHVSSARVIYFENGRVAGWESQR